jgi:hypothetical protein
MKMVLIMKFMSRINSGNISYDCNSGVCVILQLDEINQLFLPYMRNKLLWFYQDVEDAEPSPPIETVSLS